MRILHTSDWHLGQHFMGKTRQAEHQAFCAWLLEQVRTHEVDAVLIAGDIFDTGTPPSYAREQYNRLVIALREAGCALVVLGGNHDSPAMLGESRELLAQLGAQVVPAVSADPGEQVMVLRTRAGTPGAILCAIPFIRPRDVLTSQAGQGAQDKQQALQQAIQQHYQTLYALAEAQRDALGEALPIIATGHLTTVGASASDSVREIYVGSLEAFPTNAFPPAAYIALGHIHRPQKVAGLEHIRYSGSPIALSFDEAKQQKEVLLLEFAASTLQAVTALPVPCFQPMASLRGSLKDLATSIAAQASLGTPERPVWLEIQVSTDDYLNDLQSHINTLCEGLPVEVLRIRRERGTSAANLASSARETLDELTAEDVFARRLQLEQLDEADTQRLQGLYREVLEGLDRT
ncbi:MAG: exonuclease subunit SbcD [Gammaproteobacteria bacterium]|nr:exonuclease subunit SbcD [Gammaproteobacteria bacterium]MBU1489458.1 exonuclease subunit SbcD [Gammaproteobacteria bacterium]MBU2137951.1 exonuclease subunit SbcD [Gammaproteobacteria bacterium]MBU2215930.1 exonuclease subunit SbcD [Gammaproteobacteria bacterium]MBU2322503.1 exonuclease subunit SbcD [Gammaproteobacteria bacterium]